jgi:hypothetical protein
MLELKEDVEYPDIVTNAYELVEFVVKKYNIKTFDEFTCPYFKDLAKEMYYEVK